VPLSSLGPRQGHKHEGYEPSRFGVEYTTGHDNGFSGRGRELHRAAQAYHLDGLAARVEPGGGRAWVLGRDPQQRRPRLRPSELGVLRHREHELAGSEAQVDELVVTAVRLPQDVLADYSQVGRAVVDVRRHVGRAHQDDPNRRPLHEQLAPELVSVQARHSDACQQLQGAGEKRPCGDRDRDLHRAAHVSLAAKRPATCSGGRRCALWPCAVQETVEPPAQWTRFVAPTARHQLRASG